MVDENKIISLIKQKGPVLPVQLTKELNTTPLFAGAILSELVGDKKLKLSFAKIGSSPVYYLAGQEEKLPSLLYNYLHEKEKKAFDLLKESKVLRDRDNVPVIRVALRTLKDFAVPFEVIIDKDMEIFWKYFLVPDSEAKKIILSYLAKQEEKKSPSKKKKKPKQAPKKKQRKNTRKNQNKKESKTLLKKKSPKNTLLKKKKSLKKKPVKKLKKVLKKKK